MQFGTIFYYTRRVTDAGFDELVLPRPRRQDPLEVMFAE